MPSAYRGARSRQGSWVPPPDGALLHLDATLREWSGLHRAQSSVTGFCCANAGAGAIDATTVPAVPTRKRRRVILADMASSPYRAISRVALSSLVAPPIGTSRIAFHRRSTSVSTISSG